jgi:hypothetical protein
LLRNYPSSQSVGAGALYLHGAGHFHPSNVIDNEFLCSLDIGIDPGWVEERVGILERRTTLSLDYIRTTRNADTRAAAEASKTSSVEMGNKLVSGIGVLWTSTGERSNSPDRSPERESSMTKGTPRDP